MNVATSILDVSVKWEAAKNWILPRIKDQISKMHFISVNEPLLTSLLIIWRPDEAGIRTQHATVTDLMKLESEHNVL